MEFSSTTTTKTHKEPIISKLSGKGATNEILYLCREDAERNLIYYPGDIQDLEEPMKRNGEGEWTEYSLESTTSLLYRRFAGLKCNVFVVRPERKLGSLSEYDNHLRPGKGIAHVHALLKAATSTASKNLEMKCDFDKPIVIAGFSKGSLVLNHLMAELATALDCSSKEKTPEFVYDWELDKKDWALPSYEPSQRIGRTKTLSIAVEENSNEIFELFDKVESVHWIDGHRFPTNQNVIAAISNYFSKEKKKIFIHATPRQVKDSRRKWIKKEYSLFLEGLKQQGAPFTSKLYFESEPPSLEYHFKILQVFDLV